MERRVTLNGFGRERSLKVINKRDFMRLPASIDLVRLHNCVLAGTAVLIGMIVAVASSNIILRQAALAFAVALLVCAGGNATNDYYDREIDRINRPERPIPSGRLKARDALLIGGGLFTLGILLSILLDVPCIILAVVNSVVLAFYAAELKRLGLVGNLIVGYLVGSTFLFGGLAAKNAPKLQALGVLAAMAAVATVGRELIKDIEDMKGDNKIGLKTFPLSHGPRAAAALAVVFIAAAIILSPVPYLLNFFGKFYLTLVMISVLIFIGAAIVVARDQKPESAGRASLACKVGMGIGLIAFLVGAIA
jgi:geranylgeranylglycerol-phosphate geranylgeranyltransferase